MTRRQLLSLGFSKDAIKHRIATGRLHPVHPGVYAAGSPRRTRHGRWMAAVLSCGEDAVLSHASAAALWGIGQDSDREVEVSVPDRGGRRRRGVVVHRRSSLSRRELTRRDRIPVTSPAATLTDLAARLTLDELEAAINDADKLGLIAPDVLRRRLAGFAGRLGVAPLREALDRRTFTLTDSRLERELLRIVRSAGLPRPQTGRHLNGFKVDFFWPDLGLVVETDGLRYHRTPAQQTRDRLRDQAHTAAGLTPLRFTRAQVKLDPSHVEATIEAVVRRLTDASERRAPRGEIVEAPPGPCRLDA